VFNVTLLADNALIFMLKIALNVILQKYYTFKNVFLPVQMELIFKELVSTVTANAFLVMDLITIIVLLVFLLSFYIWDNVSQNALYVIS
jgi:hypothetical protein